MSRIYLHLNWSGYADAFESQQIEDKPIAPMTKEEIEELRKLASEVDRIDRASWQGDVYLSGKENMYLGGYQWATTNPKDALRQFRTISISQYTNIHSAAWCMGFLDCLGDCGYETLDAWIAAVNDRKLK